MFEALMIGAQAVLTVQGLLMIVLGVVVGIIFGAIPGLSATMAIALFLPITYGLSSINGIVLLVGLYVGGISGGLISAILTRIPGTPSSVATCFDGYPMTQKGEGMKALGVGVVFSFVGTFLSVIALLFIAPPLAQVALQFGAYEYFAVALFSLTMISSLSGKSLVKGLISGFTGAMFATVGMDMLGSVKRYTLGIDSAMSGLNILPVMIGMFAVSEILGAAATSRFSPKAEVITVSMKGIKGFGFSLAEFFGQKWNALRSSLIGIAIGILPGIGGGVANVIAYGAAKSQSKYPEKFGTGIIDGVVASETSNNAAIGGAFVPLLSLGIPGDTVTAMLLGGLTIHGISPDPLMFKANIDIVYGIIIALLLANVVMLLVEFYGLRGFVALLRIPKQILLPAIFVFCIVGAFGLNGSMFDVWAVLLFGILGFFFQKMGIPLPPFILGFIIGPLAEINLRRGLMFSKGDFTPFFTSPIAAFFLAATVFSIGFTIYTQVKKSRSTLTTSL